MRNDPVPVLGTTTAVSLAQALQETAGTGQGKLIPEKKKAAPLSLDNQTWYSPVQFNAT